MIYVFIFRFLVPVFRVSSQMKKNIRNFQDQVRAQDEINQNQKAGFGANNNGTETPTPKGGEYIDFEEVKEENRKADRHPGQ
jgi:hypothetical protein